MAGFHTTTCRFGSVITLLAVAAFAPASRAQWTVVNLHPAGASSSWVHGVDGDQQVGMAELGGARAGVWTGTAASWANWGGGAWSYISGVGDGQQVGNRNVNSYAHAALWTGSALSWVDLNPAIAAHSEAYDADSGQQVGYAAGLQGGYFASLWTGSASSWVNLNPPAAAGELVISAAYGVDAGQQVGYVWRAGVGHASLWTGTAASWADLNPAGVMESTAYGIGDGQQVGWTGPEEGSHAALWSGTAASWVDLHPAGSTVSKAYDVDGGQQVGSAKIGGVERASLWTGTAASWVDLHALLPASFSMSRASGIHRNAERTIVVGEGDNNGRREALMWVGPGLCYPDCDSTGTLNVNDYICFQTKFALGEPYADCDGNGVLNVNDYICFQTKFALGCP